MLKVAFNAGSSQHGNARRAEVGSKCVTTNNLPHFNDTLPIMADFRLVVRTSEVLEFGKRANVDYGRSDDDNVIFRSLAATCVTRRFETDEILRVYAHHSLLEMFATSILLR